MRIILPITKEERNRLQIHKAEFGDAEILGMILTPSDIRRGIRRWQKQGEPSAFVGDDVFDGVNALHEALTTAHKKKVAEVEQTLLNEFETQFANHNTAAETALENQKQAAARHKNLYEKRIALKNKQLLEFRDALKTEREKVQTYHAQFGEIRSHPLNYFQRLMGRLFRIL